MALRSARDTNDSALLRLCCRLLGNRLALGRRLLLFRLGADRIETDIDDVSVDQPQRLRQRERDVGFDMGECDAIDRSVFMVTVSWPNFDVTALGSTPSCTTAIRRGTSTVPGPPAGPAMTRPSMPTFMVMMPAFT